MCVCVQMNRYGDSEFWDCRARTGGANCREFYWLGMGRLKFGF